MNKPVKSQTKKRNHGGENVLRQKTALGQEASEFRHAVEDSEERRAFPS